MSLLFIAQDSFCSLPQIDLLLRHGFPLFRHQVQELASGDVAVAQLIPNATHPESGAVLYFAGSLVRVLEIRYLLIRELQLLLEPQDSICRARAHLHLAVASRPLSLHALLSLHAAALSLHAPRADLTLKGHGK